MIKLPTIKFETENRNRYIYDAYSNNVFPISGIDEYIIDNYNNKSKDDIFQKLTEKFNLREITLAYDRIKNWIKYEGALFGEQLISMKKNLSDIEINKAIANCNQMVLILTENCNLRCKYCAYSGQFDYQRTHKNVNMSFEIAKKSIDIFNQIINSKYRTTTRDYVYIAFYGGEPFLRFKLMNKIVTYIKKVEFPCKVVFTITTNGTLLNDEIIDYCINNDFYLHFSLDGPKDYHDFQRVFPNNNGTFEMIIGNLLKIKQKNQRYYDTNVYFVVTLSPYYKNPENIIDFFLNYEAIRNNNTIKIPRFTSFDSHNLKEDSNIKKILFISKLSENLQRLFNKYCNMLIKNDINDTYFEILSSLFSDYFGRFLERTVGNCLAVPFPTATCVPGEIKLAVNPNGSITFCEKLNPYLNIGNVEQGINYINIKNIYARYINSLNEKCITCPFIRLCNMCFAAADRGENFSTEITCDQNRIRIPEILAKIFSILELNPHAFEKMKFENKELYKNEAI